MHANEVPVSPMKKMKILSEKPQNIRKSIETHGSLEPIKEINQNQAANRSTEQSLTNVEPLLQESPGQYVIFPINHEDMWKMYKGLVDNFWSVTESIQQLDTLQLSYDENQFMKYFSSIFASPNSHGLVNENFAEELCKLIQVTEAKFFYGHQLFVQNIHFEMYNRLLDKFSNDSKEEKEKLWKIVESFDAVTKKREWISKWSTKSFAEQIMASSCLHGLFFSAIELVNDWLKVKTIASSSHELIDIFERMILDQELQRDFACLMLSHLRAKPSKEEIMQTIDQAAKIEFDFLINGLKSELIGIDTEEILQLIDKKAKSLKLKMSTALDEKKKSSAEFDQKVTKIDENQENQEIRKENSQHKFVLDEDF